MSEENKALALHSWEIVNRRDLDAIQEFYAPDLVWHEPDQDIHGSEEAKRFLATYFRAFPDLTHAVEDVIAEGEKVVTHYTLSGTHQGETKELGPPTGKRIELEGITIHRIEDGKIVEEWEAFDSLIMLQQLGLAPEQ